MMKGMQIMGWQPTLSPADEGHRQISSLEISSIGTSEKCHTCAIQSRSLTLTKHFTRETWDNQPCHLGTSHLFISPTKGVHESHLGLVWCEFCGWWWLVVSVCLLLWLLYIIYGVEMHHHLTPGPKPLHLLDLSPTQPETEQYFTSDLTEIVRLSLFVISGTAGLP